MFAMIGHYVGGCNEEWNVCTGLLRQIVVDFPEGAVAARASNGFVDITRAAIVGGDGKVPVVELVIEFFQEFTGGFGRFVEVIAFIDITVDLKSLHDAGGRDELPKACCASWAISILTQCRFDTCQVFEFGRQFVFLKCILENGEIVVEPNAYHAFDKRTAAHKVKVERFLDGLVEWHFNNGR